jgi:hypothetical protein
VTYGAGQIDGMQDLSIDRSDRERASCIGRRKLLQTVNMRVLAVAGVVGLRRGITGRRFDIKRIVMMRVVAMIAVTMFAARPFKVRAPMRHNDFANAMRRPVCMGVRWRRRQNAKLRQGDRQQTGQELAKQSHRIKVSASLLPLFEEPSANIGWSAPAQAVSRSTPRMPGRPAATDERRQWATARPPAIFLERLAQFNAASGLGPARPA